LKILLLNWIVEFIVKYVCWDQLNCKLMALVILGGVLELYK